MSLPLFTIFRSSLVDWQMSVSLHVSSGCACLSVPAWPGTVLSAADLHRVADADSHRRLRSIHIDSSAARSMHETLDSWWPSFPSYCCMRLEQSTTQCHFSAFCVYFQKETENQNFTHRFPLTDYKLMHVLFYMPLIYVYFLIRRLCGPLYRAIAAKLSLCHVNLFVN